MRIEDYEISRHVAYRPWRNAGREFLLSNYPYMDIVLNDACNCQCAFCIGHLVHQPKRLDVEAVKPKIRFAIEQTGVREVLLLGGEATINADLLPTIRYLAATYPMQLKKICLTTNGHRLVNDSAYLNDLMASGLTHMNLSLMSLDRDKQRAIHGGKTTVGLHDLTAIRRASRKNNVHLRINQNVWLGKHDSVVAMLDFHEAVAPYCDSVKFSPLLKTDAFSTINEVTEWNRKHCLPDETYDQLWHELEDYYGNWPILRNTRTFGFVEYSMVLLPVPIILNYNQHGQLMRKVTEEGKINNLKLLATGDLSLSWNREMPQYFIQTICDGRL